MTGLRATAHGIARGGAAAELVTHRLLAIERVAAGLANRRLRARDADPDRLLRRRIAIAWHDTAALDALAARPSRSGDRAVILAYLLHYPLGQPGFARLRAAAALAAERHDWPWRDRGRRWGLWDGTAGLAAADLADAGLVGRLAGGAFAQAVRRG